MTFGSEVTTHSERHYSIDFPYEVKQGEDRALVVVFAYRRDSSQGIGGVTYDGVPLTLVAQKGDPGGDAKVAMFYLLDPPVGTGTVVISLTSAARTVAAAYTLYGVDQYDPLVSYGASKGTASSTSLTLDSNAGDLALDVIGMPTRNGLTPGAGQTEIWDEQINASTDVRGAGSREAAAGSTVAMSYAISASRDYAYVAAVFRAAQGDPATATPGPSPTSTTTAAPVAGWKYAYYAYGSPKPHAVTDIDRGTVADSFTYDAIGDMIWRAESGVQWTQTFDEEGRLSGLQSTNGSSTRFDTLVSQGKPATASAYLQTDPPENAFDGNRSTKWSAGAHPPAWVEVDLGQERIVSDMRLIVSQYPAGYTLHEVQVAGEDRVFETARTLGGYTSDGQELEISFDPFLVDVRYVRVRTETSPSWVAWYEVDVYSPQPYEVAFAYDGDGVRVKQENPDGTTTLFLAGGAYEVHLNAGGQETLVRRYYGVASLRVMIEGSETYYLLTDHLGSVVAAMDSSGDLVSEQRYLPYGLARFTPGITETDSGFTGQRHLAAAGLMDYNARWYRPEISRFVSADPITQRISDPLSMNRYSYAGSNPLRYTDPSGHYICEDIYLCEPPSPGDPHYPSPGPQFNDSNTAIKGYPLQEVEILMLAAAIHSETHGEYPDLWLEIIAWVYLNRLTLNTHNNLWHAIMGIQSAFRVYYGPNGRFPANFPGRPTPEQAHAYTRRLWEWVQAGGDRDPIEAWNRSATIARSVYDNWLRHGTNSNVDVSHGATNFLVLDPNDRGKYPTTVEEQIANFEATERYTPGFKWQVLGPEFIGPVLGRWLYLFPNNISLFSGP